MRHEWVSAPIPRQELRVIHQAHAALHPSNNGNIGVGISVNVSENFADTHNPQFIVRFPLPETARSSENKAQNQSHDASVARLNCRK